jgi:MOSC domain-containing protein YiiM
MKLLSVNVGLPSEVASDRGLVLTSIFKSPAAGRIDVRGHNLTGDRQSDLKVHGGVYKAVYAYPSEHYSFWKERLADVELPWGAFGENLTTEGILEYDVHVGDRLRIGSAEFVVTQPRMPCFKLGIRLGRPDMIKQFLDSRRSGFYLSIAREGDVAAGDTIAVIARHPAGISIPEVLRMHLREERDPLRLAAALQNDALSDAWRNDLRERLREALRPAGSEISSPR